MSGNSVSNIGISKRSFEFDKSMVTVFLGVLSFFLLPQLDITEWTLMKSILISFSVAFLSLGALTWYAWLVKEDSIVLRLLTRKDEAQTKNRENSGKPGIILEKPERTGMRPDKRGIVRGFYDVSPVP